MEFRTDPIFDALKSPLGVVDDPDRRKQLEAYVEAARLPLERAALDLLAQVADALNEEVSAHYEVTAHYRAGAIDLQVRRREPAEADDAVLSFTEGDVEKVTLRIPAELKDMAMEAATKAGLSSNSWFVRMLARALRSAEDAETPRRRRGRHESRHGGGRLSGWVGPD